MTLEPNNTFSEEQVTELSVLKKKRKFSIAVDDSRNFGENCQGNNGENKTVKSILVLKYRYFDSLLPEHVPSLSVPMSSFLKAISRYMQGDHCLKISNFLLKFELQTLPLVKLQSPKAATQADDDRAFTVASQRLPFPHDTRSELSFQAPTRKNNWNWRCLFSSVSFHLRYFVLFSETKKIKQCYCSYLYSQNKFQGNLLQAFFIPLNYICFRGHICFRKSCH